MTKPLSDLKPGEKGIVTYVSGQGAIQRRILDIGLVPGTTVEVEKYAPLGDPMQVKLLSFQLTLRKREASCITVETA